MILLIPILTKMKLIAKVRYGLGSTYIINQLQSV